MREIKLRVQVLRPLTSGARGAWSKWYVGVSLQEMRATMQVMLGVSLQARWDATLAVPMHHIAPSQCNMHTLRKLVLTCKATRHLMGKTQENTMQIRAYLTSFTMCTAIINGG